MMSFQAAFLSFPPSNTDSPVKVRCNGTRFSKLPLIRLRAASVDGRLRRGSNPDGEGPIRLVEDVPKYPAELGRRIDVEGVGLGRAGETGRGDADTTLSCSRTRVNFEVSLSRVIHNVLLAYLFDK